MQKGKLAAGVKVLNQTENSLTVLTKVFITAKGEAKGSPSEEFLTMGAFLNLKVS